MSDIKERIKELLSSRIEDMRNLGKVLQEEEYLKERLHLEKVKQIQTRHPEVIVGGSIALYLHGCKPKRFSENNHISDIDIVLPYWIDLSAEDLDIVQCPGAEISKDSDYEEVYTFRDANFNVRKMDVRIDPKQRYEKIKFEDFTYKVCKLEDILIAKLKYAKQGNYKHLKDVYDICGKEIDKKEEVKPVQPEKERHYGLTSS